MTTLAPALSKRGAIQSIRWDRHKIAVLALAAVTLVALLAPVLAPYNPLVPVDQPFMVPFGAAHLLGTDSVGRDVLSRVLYGVRSSWLSAIAVISFGVLLGGTIGMIAGVSGSKIDSILMRITDGFLAFPGPVLAIAVVASLGASLLHTLIAVAIVWWPFYARIVRAEARAIMSRPHIEAAKTFGVGYFRLALRHVLPGVVPAVIVTASLDVGNLVIALSGLSFLGLGAPAPSPELGAMAARNLQYLLQQWWVCVMPALAIAVMAIISNFAGDALRDFGSRGQ
ncbi:MULTISPECIES: ABC transporter permease [Acidithrix]|uniref:Putative D,D-dipeptide transport system permease protein DdpC n=1 Tax=Acidithrix ferrooxidans TaxID=1280514 RepID=A0A0D8HEU3_9ACTN|nr:MULTISPECIES: ABC transporter permease [Acidithrix]KJF16384.1 putative D,D-dipeptide transport system permease protein DdpC [Acidithrix ferrooxidans]